MAIGAIGSATSAAATYSAQKPEALEPKGAPDHDHDQDNVGGGSTNTVKPTVNTQGQAIGHNFAAKA